MPHQIFRGADGTAGAAGVDGRRDFIRGNAFDFRPEFNHRIGIKENGFFRFHTVDILRVDRRGEISVGDSADELRCSEPACGEPE